MSQDDWAEQAPNEDDFAMDGEGVSQDALGGGALDREGWYHFEIVDVVPELDPLSKSGKDKTPAVRFDMAVRKTVEGQSPDGTKHFHRIYVGGKGGEPIADGARNSAMRFGLGLGLLREVDAGGQKSIVDAATNAAKITIGTWRRAKGCQCVAKITKDTDAKYGDRYQIPFGRVYRPDDPSVKDVPIDLEVWQLAENFTPTPPGPSPDEGGGGSGVPAPTKPPTTPPAKQFADCFAPAKQPAYKSPKLPIEEQAEKQAAKQQSVDPIDELDDL